MIFLEYLLLLNYPLHLFIIVFLTKIMIIYIYIYIIYDYIYIYICLKTKQVYFTKNKLRLLRLWLNKI